LRGPRLGISLPRVGTWLKPKGDNREKKTAMMSRLGRQGFKYQLLVTTSIFIGLFFLEYPPIFLLGYWSWGAVAHKALTGVLLVLNLLLAQFTARRLGFFRDTLKADGGEAGRNVPEN
jgi:hypothetical protein